MDAVDVQTTSFRLRSAADRLSTSLSTPRSVHAELAGLLARIDHIAAGLAGRGHSLDAPSAEESRAALAHALDRELLRLKPGADRETVLDALARNDEYFGVRRRRDLEPEPFLHQLMVTTGLVLRDLACCMLDLHEIVMILRGLAAGIAGGVDPAPPPQEDIEAAPTASVDEDMPDAQVRAMAIWRWKVGHHLFNQHAIMSFHLIEASMAAADPEAKAVILDRLCHTYRATTAAMWYGEAFPAQLYTEVIRPSMVEASPSGAGLSGTDHLDFRLMKARLRDMLNKLKAEMGPVDSWPESLWGAVRRLYEVQQLDLEHHVLIAQKVVGDAPSLRQETMAEKSGRDVELGELSGVDTLRGMVAERANAKAGFLAGF